MKSFLYLPIFLNFFFPVEVQASKNLYLYSVCESFAAGKLDAIKTLEALDLNVDDYSIGVNNTAKIFCE
tara:strand:+ start:174 stop:380 length:207 start_codon:yes stop_codon:yes gene_type:complete